MDSLVCLGEPLTYSSEGMDFVNFLVLFCLDRHIYIVDCPK
jgi:hypothetical protein